ncbi:MAG: hypothetical protein ACRC78_18305, partial [Planktothrix sp.]
SVVAPASYFPPAVVAPTIQDTTSLEGADSTNYGLLLAEIDVDGLVYEPNYKELRERFTLSINDTLKAGKNYDNIAVKGKNFSLTAMEFDNLFDNRKIKQIKNRLWVRVASPLPKAKGKTKKIKSSRVAGFNEIKGFGSFIRVVFGKVPCRNKK